MSVCALVDCADLGDLHLGSSTHALVGSCFDEHHEEQREEDEHEEEDL